MNSIEPYSEMEPSELDEEDWKKYREEVRQRYYLYVMNPARESGVNYSLFVVEGEYEYQVLSSNTGGFTTFNSRSKSFGDGLEPTDEFLDLVGYGVHEMMSFTPAAYTSDDFMQLAEDIYDGKIREYEVWAAETLVRQFVLGEELIPELESLARWSSKFTNFSVPILNKEEQ